MRCDPELVQYDFAKNSSKFTQWMTQHQNLMDCGERFFQYGSYLCTLSLQPVCTFCLQNLHFHPCFVWPAQWKGSRKYDGFQRQNNVWLTSEHLAAEITRCYFLVSVFNEKVSIAFVAHSISILRLKIEKYLPLIDIGDQYAPAYSSNVLWPSSTYSWFCDYFSHHLKCFLTLIRIFLSGKDWW